VRIGIVSDTHNNLRNVERIAELFDAAGVDRVVHTGDITQAKTLKVLARMKAPLFGVYGNNDLERDSLERACRQYQMRLVDPPLRIEWADRRIVVVHDPHDLDARRLEGCDVALHGHDHRLTLQRRRGALVMNPGECAGHVRGQNAVGLLDLASLQADVLRF
jgi:putative phosphoesterase